MTIINLPWADEPHLAEILKAPSFVDYFICTASVARLVREGAPNINIVTDSATTAQIWERFAPEIKALIAEAPEPAAATQHLQVLQAINYLSKFYYRKCKPLLGPYPDRNLKELIWPTDLHFIAPHKNYQAVKRLTQFVTQKYKGADVLCEMINGPQEHAITTAEAMDIYEHFKADVDKEIDITAYEKKYAWDDYKFYAVNAAVNKILTRVYQRYEKEIIAAPDKPLKAIIANSRLDKRVRAVWEL